MQTHRIIDQICKGDSAHEIVYNLAQTYVEVERVVDIVTKMFRSNAAMSLYEGSAGLEVPYSTL